VHHLVAHRTDLVRKNRFSAPADDAGYATHIEGSGVQGFKGFVRLLQQCRERDPASGGAKR
jgi:hypothetical protein